MKALQLGPSLPMDRWTYVSRIRSWRVYEGLNASGGLRPSVYTGLNALQTILLRTNGIRTESVSGGPLDVWLIYDAWLVQWVSFPTLQQCSMSIAKCKTTNDVDVGSKSSKKAWLIDRPDKCCIFNLPQKLVSQIFQKDFWQLLHFQLLGEKALPDLIRGNQGRKLRWKSSKLKSQEEI